MAPSEFWRLTYAELRLVLEGCDERRAREMKFQRRLSAWMASIVIAPHVKEMVTPAALLGEKEPKPRKKMSREQALDKALDIAFKHFKRD